jgi:hypothetical protein
MSFLRRMRGLFSKTILLQMTLRGDEARPEEGYVTRSPRLQRESHHKCPCSAGFNPPTLMDIDLERRTAQLPRSQGARYSTSSLFEKVVVAKTEEITSAGICQELASPWSAHQDGLKPITPEWHDSGRYPMFCLFMNTASSTCSS